MCQHQIIIYPQIMQQQHLSTTNCLKVRSFVLLDSAAKISISKETCIEGWGGYDRYGVILSLS